MVVTVEVWPGGRILGRQVIGTMNLANVSELSEVSDYEGTVDGRTVRVYDHVRSDGCWALVERALQVDRLTRENTDG